MDVNKTPYRRRMMDITTKEYRLAIFEKYTKKVGRGFAVVRTFLWLVPDQAIGETIAAKMADAHKANGRQYVVESVSMVTSVDDLPEYHQAKLAASARAKLSPEELSALHASLLSSLGHKVPALVAPATEAPATEAPATEAPATEAPATEAPAETTAVETEEPVLVL
jgi:hypothetical protein